MSDETAGPRTGHRCHRAQLPRALVAALMILLLAAWGCSDGGDDDLERPEPEVIAEPTAPAIPQPDEPDPEPADTPMTPPAPRPRPGPVVLVHLEGPVTNAEATDVVVRSERGVELDRFRLPGALEVHTGHGSRWALIPTNTGQWASYDATDGTLSLLIFDGDPPTGAPTVHGAVAWWQDPARPWLIDLASGETRSLRPQIGESGRITAASPSGSHLLIRGERDHILDSSDGTARTLPPQDFVTLSADGTLVASTASADAGADVYLEGIDGADRHLVATVPDLGVPVALPDGRVLVLGTASRLIRPDGTLTDLPALPGAADPVVADDGQRVLVTTDAGLALVDPDTATVTPVADSRGWAAFTDGPRTVLWAASADRSRPGVVAVDPATGVALPFLPDTPTGPLTSISSDGRSLVLQVGEVGTDQALLTADGETALAVGATDAALHPDGDLIVLGVIADVTRSLLIGTPAIMEDVAQAQMEIATGRHPVWVHTDPPDADR